MHTARRLAFTATLLIAGGSAGCAAHGPHAPAGVDTPPNAVTTLEPEVGPGAGDLLGVALFGMHHDAELRQIAAYRLLTDRRLASAGTAAD